MHPGTVFLLTIVLSSVVGIRAGKALDCPPQQYPLANVQTALHESDNHAWALFLALNRPADPNSVRGTPDPSKKPGDPGRLVWETWKLARTEIFKDDGHDPGPWNTLGAPLENKLGDPPKTSAVIGSLSPRGFKPLFDPGETGNETRMNCETYKFIVENELYNIEGQERFMAQEVPLKFPLQSMEVKASWRKFTQVEEKTDLVKRYYTFTDSSGQIWGLATLHILTKELPNWFWTSFRQKEGPTPLYPKGDSAGMPAELKGTFWENYELSGAQTNFVDTIGRPIVLSDPIIEAGFEKSSCMGCHSHAGIRRIINGRRDEMPFAFGLDIDQQLITPLGAPNPSLFLENAGQAGADQSVFQQDFVFSLRRAKNRK